jgi:hypothetical protein
MTVLCHSAWSFANKIEGLHFPRVPIVQRSNAHLNGNLGLAWLIRRLMRVHINESDSFRWRLTTTDDLCMPII